MYIIVRCYIGLLKEISKMAYLCQWFMPYYWIKCIVGWILCFAFPLSCFQLRMTIYSLNVFLVMNKSKDLFYFNFSIIPYNVCYFIVKVITHCKRAEYNKCLQFWNLLKDDAKIMESGVLFSHHWVSTYLDWHVCIFSSNNLNFYGNGIVN